MMSLPANFSSRDQLAPIALQWRFVALKIPEVRIQCPPVIVFTTPVGFGERDTHLWASILQNLSPFREWSFPL